MPNLARVLIANRGEIAIRLASAAASLDLETVAVFVDADADALHTRVTDHRVRLDSPPGDPVAGYLDVDAVVRAALESGCDAVHPGYGFLAESARFATACAAAGVTFVGPTADALALFGDKVKSRALAEANDVPTVPGSAGILTSIDDAVAGAAQVGYPVMLKASAGGGGRGMRRVVDEVVLRREFDRCRSEAEAAFGDGSLFLERVIEHARHIEVQLLADADGHVVHLFDRDCSVQLRNQKVVEVAPAVGLEPELRTSIHGAAIRLAQAGGLRNAATAEFLVLPDSGEYFFIECNPRIQVEHTITEEVTGIDLVVAQFEIATGATLPSIGLDQSRIGVAGFAVQARVVATSVGTISAYREPTGRGVRVDGAGYDGVAVSSAFDPLIAKVIGTSRRSLSDALAITGRALSSFRIEGVTTNLGPLEAIVAEPALAIGHASTTFLADRAELLDADRADSAVRSLTTPSTPEIPATSAVRSLDVDEGLTGVAAPGEATVVEVLVVVGDIVTAGQPLLVASAMKMETVVAAPVAGAVVEMMPLRSGDTIHARQCIIVLDPSVAGDALDSPTGAGPWDEILGEFATLRRLAEERLAPGSTDPGVVRQRSRDKLTCRERIDLLLDAGSFREIGSASGFASYDERGAIAAFTPANSVGGTGTIEARPMVVCADDFTSRGGHSDGAIAAKSTYLDQLSVQLRVPSIRLLDGSSGGGSVASMVPEQKQVGDSNAEESSGAITAGKPRVSGGGGSFLPGHLGSSDYALQLATVPVVNVLLGSVVGLGAAKAVLGHFSVMVRDTAQLFVAGPPVVSHAMGVDVTKEALGGWHIHCRNGSVDNLSETEEDAMNQTRRFLSYLPPSVFDPPVAVSCTDPVDRRDDELSWIIPRKRTTTFDMRRAIELMADTGSFFEIGPHWGTDQITGFVRFNGHAMGVIASDSQHLNGGALTADGCDKLTRHLDLCDLFHLPVLNLVDNPGFAVGIEHEEAGTIRKGGAWMVAFAQTEVPVFTVIMRRSFGVAGNNFATPRSEAAARVVWPAADAGGIPPEGGIEAAYKRQLAEAEDPAALRAELYERIESARGPLGPLSRFQMEEMIDPRDTRRLVCEWADTAVRIASSPDRLGPRPLGFRP